MTAVRIRPARPSDGAFILGLAPRLIEFGAVPGRDSARMVQRDRSVLAEALDRASDDTALFVAEEDGGAPLGFVHLTTAEDYYSDSRTAHVADLVVAPNADGRGVGTALLAHGESWARARGFPLLTLNVFVGNRKARDFYQKRGFQEEWIRCVKRLAPCEGPGQG